VSYLALSSEYQINTDNTHTITAVMLSMFMALFGYVLFGRWFIAPIFDFFGRLLSQSQDVKDQRKMHELAEQKKDRDYDREYEHRKRMLELDILGMMRIMDHQSHIDRQKIKILEGLQSDLSHKKRADLSTISDALQRMRK
jgi:hypothetical protein